MDGNGRRWCSAHSRPLASPPVRLPVFPPTLPPCLLTLLSARQSARLPGCQCVELCVLAWLLAARPVYSPPVRMLAGRPFCVGQMPSDPDTCASTAHWHACPAPAPPPSGPAAPSCATDAIRYGRICFAGALTCLLVARPPALLPVCPPFHVLALPPVRRADPLVHPPVRSLVPSSEHAPSDSV